MYYVRVPKSECKAASPHHATSNGDLHRLDVIKLGPPQRPTNPISLAGH